MTLPLKITKTEGYVTILHFHGHLDGQTENLAIASARTALNGGVRFLLLDLSGVDVISSAGLRALHAIYKMFTIHEEDEIMNQAHVGEIYKSPYLKLACATPRVYDVLGMTGFLQNISTYPTVEEALQSFSS
jgi:anti-anti-sigma factor